MKKRSGTIGPYTVNFDAKGSAIGGQSKFMWPTDQKAIENLVLDYFLAEREKVGVTVISRKDGGTQDLDFRLQLSDGEVDLELMEVVLRRGKEIPFQPGNGTHVSGEYADAVFSQVQKKINKYGSNHQVPIDLLLYITHEQYSPNQAALDVLRIYFRERPHSFRRIFFLVPVAEDSCEVNEIFGGTSDRSLPELEAITDVRWLNMPAP